MQKAPVYPSVQVQVLQLHWSGLEKVLHAPCPLQSASSTQIPVHACCPTRHSRESPSVCGQSVPLPTVTCVTENTISAQVSAQGPHDPTQSMSSGQLPSPGRHWATSPCT